MIKKAFYPWVGALIVIFLNGCVVNIVNLKPDEAPDAEIVVLERAVIKAKAAQQCDVLALAEQTKQMLLLSLPLHEYQQWVYNDRKSGGSYSKEVKWRIEKAIRDNWKLVEEAAKLYSLSSTLNSPLSGEGKSLAKATVETADSADEANQLMLGYVIAGLEWNAGYLKAEKETYTNDLLKKNEALAIKTSVLTRAFVARIAAQAGNEKVTMCPEVPVGPGKKAGSLSVLFEGDGDDVDNKSLKEAVLQAAAGTSLTTRHKRVTVTLKNVVMDRSNTVMNAFTLIMVGYPGGGGNASLSAFVQEEGGKQTPLVVDTFEINAKSFETLTSLMANRVVGRAHFALLWKDMK